MFLIVLCMAFVFSCKYPSSFNIGNWPSRLIEEWTKEINRKYPYYKDVEFGTLNTGGSYAISYEEKVMLLRPLF